MTSLAAIWVMLLSSGYDIHMAKRRVDLGVTGEVTRMNIKRVRRAKKLRLEDLSNRLAELGHPLSKASLSQIETGGRRIDVDDLASISTALGVSPVDLMLVDEVRGMHQSVSSRLNEEYEKRERMSTELRRLSEEMLGY